MKRMEKIIKDIVYPKLTIATDRITMKFPLNMNMEEKVKAEKFFDYISDQLLDTKVSMRGSLTDPRGIKMKNDKNTLRKYFKNPFYEI